MSRWTSLSNLLLLVKNMVGVAVGYYCLCIYTPTLARTVCLFVCLSWIRFLRTVTRLREKRFHSKVYTPMLSMRPSISYMELLPNEPCVKGTVEPDVTGRPSRLTCALGITGSASATSILVVRAPCNA